MCDIAIYADDTTLYSMCDQASDLWQHLDLASELQSDLRDTVPCSKKWLVDFNAKKTQLVSFDQSNNNSTIDVKKDGSVLEEKSSFKMLGLIFSSKLDWDSYIISIAKTKSKKLLWSQTKKNDVFAFFYILVSKSHILRNILPNIKKKNYTSEIEQIFIYRKKPGLLANNVAL